MSLNPQIVDVRVGAPMRDLKSAQKLLANVLGKLGCPACLSGFDIRFRNRLDFVIDQQTLDVRQIGQ